MTFFNRAAIAQLGKNNMCEVFIKKKKHDGKHFDILIKLLHFRCRY